MKTLGVVNIEDSVVRDFDWIPRYRERTLVLGWKFFGGQHAGYDERISEGLFQTKATSHLVAG